MVEELMQRHTLYPFYAAFLPQARSQQVLKAMRSNDGDRLHAKLLALLPEPTPTHPMINSIGQYESGVVV